MIVDLVRRRALSGLASLGVAALLLAGCSSHAAPAAEQEHTESAASAERTVTIMVSEPLDVAMPFEIVDSSGVLDETIALGAGETEIDVDVPADADDTITASIDVAAAQAAGYALESDSVLESSFGGGTLLYFSFTLRKGVVGAEPSSADPGGSITWKMGSEKGYTYDLTLDLYPPVDGGEVNGNVIGDVCEFDPAQDIAVPGRLTATATTEGFATPVSAALMIQHQTDLPYTGTGAQPMRDDSRLRIERYFASGPECDGWSSTGYWAGSNPISVKWTDPVATGDSVQSTFTIIVKNYYTPNTPTGDPELLDWIEVRSGMSATGNEQTGAFSDVEGTAIGGVSTKGLNLNGAVVGPRS